MGKSRIQRVRDALTAVSKVWSPVNQAWLVLWHDQVLRVLTSEPEADHYIAEITR